jgi:hypothetical protein
MTDWDDDSKQLRANLRRVLSDALQDARRRRTPDLEQARSWQSNVMHGLTSPGSQYVGRFRGEPGLAGCEIKVGDCAGVSSDNVAEELKKFEAKLQTTVEALDGLIKPGQDLSADDVAAVIDLCAWVHSEWVRIHPFANGNGRTARLWANCIAMRYGLPPFVRLRPRPDDGYDVASAEAMAGHWQAMVRVFRRMYQETIRR